MHELKGADPEVEIIWKAFELRPEPIPTLDSRGDYIAAKKLEAEVSWPVLYLRAQD